MQLSNNINNILDPITKITLADAKRVAFLNRFDTKFTFKADGVGAFIDSIKNDYAILQIGEHIIQEYDTVYFDTPNLLCYNMHHNKRAKRFKFRTRKYLSNGKIYNEIKQKLNTGKTIKYRQRRDGQSDIVVAGKPLLPALQNLQVFDEYFAKLLRYNGYAAYKLAPTLGVKFYRATFINKNFPERMTLDVGLSYEVGGETWSLDDIAIVELKREKSPTRTVAQNYFRSIGKNPSGFSKYAIGISLTYADVKKNLFLPTLKNLTYERTAA